MRPALAKFSCVLGQQCNKGILIEALGSQAPDESWASTLEKRAREPAVQPSLTGGAMRGVRRGKRVTGSDQALFQVECEAPFVSLWN